MVREIITISIGECGIRIGNEVWKNYCCEHDISYEGEMIKKNKNKNINNSLRCVWDEQSNNRFVPRYLMLDTDCNAIDYVKNSKQKLLYQGQYRYYARHGKENAANNYLRGYSNSFIDHDILLRYYNVIKKLQKYFTTKLEK